MDTITRSVKDIAAADRQALEHVIGRHLFESQQVVIQVQNTNIPTPAQPDAEKPDADATKHPLAHLPQWCNVYEGLTDLQIADIENSIIRSHDSRSFQ